MANLHWGITADNKGFMDALRQIQTGIQSTSAQLSNSGVEMDAMFSKLSGSAMRFAGMLGVATGLKEFASQTMSIRGEFQKLEVAFETMLGSKERSDALMQQIVRTAAITPFGLQEVAGGAKSLMAFGIQAEEVNETLMRLGDIASALSIPMGDMVYLYGTSMVQGRMYGQDLQQFMGRGIPLAEELAKQLGITKSEVKDAVSAGKIGAEEVKKAIWSMTDKGSMFGGLMERQSETINGQIANIQDAIEVMFNDIGQSQEGVINLGLDLTSRLVENWQTVLSLVGGVAATYGAQKGFLALSDGFNRAQGNYQYQIESEQLQTLIPSKEAESVESEKQAVAKVHLTEAQAAHIEALRQEAQAYLESLEIEESSALSKLQFAQEAVEAQEREIVGIQDLKQSLLEQYDAAIIAGDAEEAQSIATEIATTETWLKEEAATAEALAEDLRTASVNAATASEARESAATAINTAQNAGNTASVGILTIAKEKLALAIQKVNMALKANQFAIATGAVIALGYAVYKLATYETDLEKSHKMIMQATSETENAYFKEKRTLDELNATLQLAQKGSAEWKSAKDAIISQFGQYCSNLDTEIDKVGNLASVYNQLTRAIYQSNLAKGLKKFIDDNDNNDEVMSTYGKALDNFDKDKKKLSKGYGILKPILQEYAMQYFGDADIFTFVQDKLKIKYGVDQGKYIYDTYEALLKRTDIKGFSDTHKLNRSREKDIQEYADKMGISKEMYEQVRFGKEPVNQEPEKKVSKIQLEQDVKEKQKAYNILHKKYESKEGVNQKDLDDAKTALDEAKKKLKGYEAESGKTKKQSGLTASQIASKIESAYGKSADIIRKQAEEKLRIEEDYEFERWQSRIDLMKEGYAKVEETERLNYEKEKSNLNRRQKDEEEAELNRQMAVFNAKQDELAAQNKKYAKKVFKDSDIDDEAMAQIAKRYESLNADLEKKQQAIIQARLKNATQAYNDYLKEYGSFEEKKLAISAEYNEKIEQANNNGEKLKLNAQKESAIANLKFEQWKQSGSVLLAFGDINNLTKETISQLINDLEEYRGQIIKTYDPEKIKQYNDALNALKQAQVDERFKWGDIDKIAPKLKERIKLEQEITEVEKQQREAELKWQEAYTSMLSASDGLEVANRTGDSTIIASAELEYASAKSKVEEANNRIKTLCDRLQILREKHEQLAQFSKADYEAISSGMKMLANSASDLAGVFDSDVSEGIKQVISFFEELESVAESAFIAVKALTESTVKDVTKGAQSLVDSTGNAIKTTSTGTATALKVLEKSTAILAIISAGIQLATAVFKLIQWNNNREAEERLKSLDKAINKISKSLKELEKATQKAYSWDKVRAYAQEVEKLQEKQNAILAKVDAEKSKGKGLFGKINQDEIDKLLEEYDSVNEEIENIKENALDAIFGSDLKSSIDCFASAYAEAWSTGESRVATVRDEVRRMMQDMVKEAIKAAIQSSAEMKKIRAAALEFFRDGYFDAAEQIQLERMAEELQTKLDSQFANSADLLKSKSYTQQSSSRGFQAVQQETAEELNGRFTALQESNEAIRQASALVLKNQNLSLNSLDSILSIEKDALQVHLLNESHLSRISKYTQELSGMRTTIESIERRLKGI